MKKINVFIVFLISLCLLCACSGKQGGTESSDSGSNQPVKTDISTDTMDFGFTDSDTDYGYDWMYTKKVDKCVRIRDKKKQKGKAHMSNKNSPAKYSEELKKTIVTLYQSGKTYADIKKEYGVSSSALSNWIRKYSQVRVDEDTVLTAQQIKALQRRNAELEEENLILKKAIAIFMPHSDRD